jgi:ribonuclease M5
MIQIKQAVIVEGKYDKIKVSNILDTLIIETDGFGIFKDKNKQKLIRRLAETRGILILTDSDSAGFTIRSFLNRTVKGGKIGRRGRKERRYNRCSQKSGR